jgi:hypothetical protein
MAVPYLHNSDSVASDMKLTNVKLCNRIGSKERKIVAWEDLKAITRAGDSS